MKKIALLGISCLVAVGLTAGAPRVGAVTATPPCGTPVVSGNTATETCSYTGGVQSFTVPAGVTSITVDAFGAQGAGSNRGDGGANGGEAKATLTVSPGDDFDVFVGGGGSGGTGGFNGGGSAASNSEQGGGGGGASDIRTEPYALTDRVIVAGGGGGHGARDSFTNGGTGGQIGGDGAPAPTSTSSPWADLDGEGGTGGSTVGGRGGRGGNTALFSCGVIIVNGQTFDQNGQGGGAGDAGAGGSGGQGPGGSGAGGGGGYYGGGGGGGGAICGLSRAFGGGGGGGGSSYGPAGTTFTSGNRSGNGVVIFSWTVGADISIAKSGPASAVPGSTVTDTVTVSNAGPVAGTNVVMSDAVPPGATFVSETHPTGWTCTDPPVGASTGTVSCSIASLAANSSAMFTVSNHMSPTVSSITNTATVSAGNDTSSGNNSASATTVEACDQTQGSTAGSITLRPGTTCINASNIGGNLTVPSGARLVLRNSTVTGSLVGQGSGSISVCNTTINGNVNISNATGFVLIGDPGDDQCAFNTLRSSVALNSNRAGVELGYNRISFSVVATSNSGAGPFPDDTGTQIEGNTIGGSLSCSGNTPPATNETHRNTVGGARGGECASPSF